MRAMRRMAGTIHTMICITPLTVVTLLRDPPLSPRDLDALALTKEDQRRARAYGGEALKMAKAQKWIDYDQQA